MDVAGRARELLARPGRDSSPLLWQLARDAADRGATQEELVAVFQELRNGATAEHDDRLLDVLDCISGWCHPGARVFP